MPQHELFSRIILSLNVNDRLIATSVDDWLIPIVYISYYFKVIVVGEHVHSILVCKNVNQILKSVPAEEVVDIFVDFEFFSEFSCCTHCSWTRPRQKANDHAETKAIHEKAISEHSLCETIHNKMSTVVSLVS